MAARLDSAQEIKEPAKSMEEESKVKDVVDDKVPPPLEQSGNDEVPEVAPPEQEEEEQKDLNQLVDI